MDRHNAVTRSYEIPGQCWPRELCWLYDNLRESKSHAEIGTYCGRSLFASCGGMMDATVYAIDLAEMKLPDPHYPSWRWLAAVWHATLTELREHHRTIRFEYLPFGSLTAARRLADQGVTLDSLFIDGAHEYEAVAGDIEAGRALVKPGGLICGHDYGAACPGVMRAVNESFERFDVLENARIWWTRNN